VAQVHERRGVVAGGRVEERGGGRVLADAVAAGVVGLADARKRRRLRARDGFARGSFEEARRFREREFRRRRRLRTSPRATFFSNSASRDASSDGAAERQSGQDTASGYDARRSCFAHSPQTNVEQQ